MVRWVDLPLGEVIIPNAVVDLRYCVIQKSDNFLRGARITISRCSIIKYCCSFIILRGTVPVLRDRCIFLRGRKIIVW